MSNFSFTSQECAVRSTGDQDYNQTFVSLLSELKYTLQSQDYLLTAAVDGRKNMTDLGYDIAEISRHLDMIHLSALSFHRTSDSKTGHSAPLYPRPDESVEDRALNVVGRICLA